MLRLSEKYVVFCLGMETVPCPFILSLSISLSLLCQPSFFFLNRQRFLRSESTSPVTLYLDNYFTSAKPHRVECQICSGLNQKKKGFASKFFLVNLANWKQCSSPAGRESFKWVKQLFFHLGFTGKREQQGFSRGIIK